MFSKKGSLLASAAILARPCYGALSLDATNQDSIHSAATDLLVPTLQIFNANESVVGPYDAPPVYWYEYGALWSAVLDYMAYFGLQDLNYIAPNGTAHYDANVSQAIISNAGPNYNFLPPAQTKSEGNDDQQFWTDVAMSAHEYGLPNATGVPSWLEMAQTVFDQQVRRWDTESCGGGLRWQIFTFNNGYNYKNSISTGMFFTLASRLARNNGNKNMTYSEWATKAYDWTQSVGLLDQEGDAIRVYDGTDSTTNCSQVNHIQWTETTGAYLYGCANMYAVTKDPMWLNRTQGLLNTIKKSFISPAAANVLYEVACEPNMNCNIDQLNFKGILARWMGKINVLVPQLADQITPILQASAMGAAQNCPSASRCGTHWYTASSDGTSGPSQQLAALDVVLALAAGQVKSLGNGTVGQVAAVNSTTSTSNTTGITSGAAPSTTTNAASHLTASGSLFGLCLALAAWML